MNNPIHVPQGPLSQHVSMFWYWEGAPASHRLERLLPDGASSLLVNLHQDSIRCYDATDPRRYRTLSGALFAPARNGFDVIDAACQRRIIGVQFRPGGAYAVLGVPLNALGMQDIDIDQLWGPWAADLRGRLLEAGNAPAMFLVLEQVLLQRLRFETHPAVTHAVRALSAGHRVGEVAEAISLSTRRLGELFTQQVGLTPKAYARVCRFQRVLQTLGSARIVEWSALASDCGYYDQAHFIHDFRCFSGLTPSAFTTALRPSINHVAIDEPS